MTATRTPDPQKPAPHKKYKQMNLYLTADDKEMLAKVRQLVGPDLNNHQIYRRAMKALYASLTS